MKFVKNKTMNCVHCNEDDSVAVNWLEIFIKTDKKIKINFCRECSNEISKLIINQFLEKITKDVRIQHSKP